MTRPGIEEHLGAAGRSEAVALVLDALAAPDRPDLLERAEAAARTTRDRQLVAIAAAYLSGDADRVDALARDHLADHPDNVLVAWIAATSRTDKEKP